jgi:hypothetical protein
VNATTTLVSFLCLGITPCASDRIQNDATGNKAVDHLIKDLQRERRDRAIARVSAVTTTTGKTQLVRTPTQFVDSLIGCDLVEDRTKRVGREIYWTEWSCGANKYGAYLDNYRGGPYIVVELDDENTRRHVTPAPAPARGGGYKHSPPSLEFINAIAGSLLSKEYNFARRWMKEQTIVSVSRRDLSKNVVVVEREELGKGAISPIAAAVFELVGRPASYQCEQDQYGGTCRFRFDRAGVELTSRIGVYNGAINVIRFIWETPEQNSLDVSKDWEGD